VLLLPIPNFPFHISAPWFHSFSQITYIPVCYPTPFRNLLSLTTAHSAVSPELPSEIMLDKLRIIPYIPNTPYRAGCVQGSIHCA